MDYEREILAHYTDNGKTHIAVIPQFAVPPGEQWSIDLVGIDLRSRSLLFIEVTEKQTPSKAFIDKLKRRGKWIPIIRKELMEKTKVVDDTWPHLSLWHLSSTRGWSGFTDISGTPQTLLSNHSATVVHFGLLEESHIGVSLA